MLSDPIYSRDSTWVVLKFGGTSVSDPGNWATIAEVLRYRLAQGLRPLVVCSAMAGVSSRLEGLCRAAERGDEIDGALGEIEASHVSFAAELGLHGLPLITGELEDLRRLLSGARLIREASARLRARVMVAGELMLTRIAAAWLEMRGFSVAWEDARDYLECEPQPPSASDFSRYLSARCESWHRPEVAEALERRGAEVIVTQGFSARDRAGNTVLLGRGGSDTSAALFGVALPAQRVEIWTDVPGLFTANPHAIGSARLLRRLSYDEAEVLASMGARVLHPRCVEPVRRAGIPLHVRCTRQPEVAGTVVAAANGDSRRARVKAVATRPHLELISMTRPSEWQPVGFLADVTSCFQRHGISIDLISTSASHITATIDPAATPLGPELVESLVSDLGRWCRPQFQSGVSSVSLVGSRLRSTLHELGPIFSPFEESRVHLVVQAANDLTWTFVVDADEAERLVAELHARLFEGALPDELFGPTWDSLSPATSDRNAELSVVATA